MVVPPAFSDLGQAARDLLSKGYNYGSKKKKKIFLPPNAIELY